CLAQVGAYQTVLINGQGRPLAGVSVTVCSGLATTGASVNNNVATLTFASNPITLGYTLGSPLVVYGFIGGDGYFNSPINNGYYQAYTITAVTASTISYALTAANATAGSNGNVVQLGPVATGCIPKIPTVYADTTGTNLATQPFTSDGRGNFSYFAPVGTYIAEYVSQTITPEAFVSVVPGVTSPSPLLPNIIYTGNSTYPSTAAGINNADASLGPSPGSIIVTVPGNYCDALITLSNGHTLNFTAGLFQANIAGADSNVANVTWGVEGLGANITTLQACPASGKDVITDQNFATFTGGSNLYGVYYPVIKNMTIDGNATAPYGIQLYGQVAFPLSGVVIQNTVTGNTWVEQNGAYVGVPYQINSSGIQAAINAIPATGGSIDLPCGTYTITATLLFPANGLVKLAGCGTG